MSAAPTSAINPQAFQSILSSLNMTPQQAVPGAPNSPINQFITQQNAANSANAQRGQGILGLLQGQGQAQLAMNQQGFQNQLGGINQQLTSTGLYNSTVAPNMQQGAQNWLNQANEGVNENAAMNVANMAERFTQQAPNMGLLATLLGQGGGGGVHAAGVNQGGMPGFQQPGSMLAGGGGAAGDGGLNVNNQAMSGYNSAMTNAYGMQMGTPGGPSQVPMQGPIASQAPTGPGSDYYNSFLGSLSGYMA